MEDVIFNGADGFKPLNVCQVSLTVHNNSGKLPVEYNDIEIGRRVFRNGESEYTINKTPCRLKDVNDLFLDTGMSADAYSVIEQKMIEQILSDTGDDRRRILEEAAGINKYCGFSLENSGNGFRVRRGVDPKPGFAHFVRRVEPGYNRARSERRG